VCSAAPMQAPIVPTSYGQYACGYGYDSFCTMSPLHKACMRGEVEIVRGLLQQLPAHALNARGLGGMTPLHFACSSSQNAVETAGVLLERLSTNVLRVRDDMGMTPLHRALQNTFCDVLELCEWLVAHMTDDDLLLCDELGQTVLHTVISRNSNKVALWCAKKLPANHGSFFIVDKAGNTPAMYIGSKHSAELLQVFPLEALLIKAPHSGLCGLLNVIQHAGDLALPVLRSLPADFDIRCMNSHKAWNFMHAVCSNPCSEELMVEALRLCPYSELTGATMYGGPGVRMPPPCATFCTAPLLVAVKSDIPTEALVLLLEKLDDDALSVQDSMGATALHMAASNPRQAVALLRFLPPEALALANCNGETAVVTLYDTRPNEEQLAITMAERMDGEALETITVQRSTVLIRAVKHGHTAVVEAILSKISEEAMLHVDREGRNALHYAVEMVARRGNCDLLLVLLRALPYAARVARDVDGRTPADMAIGTPAAQFFTSATKAA